MAAMKEQFGASTTMTITLASLVNGTARASTDVDNTVNLYVDVIISVTIKLVAGTPVDDKAVYLFAYGSEDGGVYTDNATGSDAAITLRTPTNLRVLGVINTPDAGGLTYVSGPLSLGNAFGGPIPRRWGVVVRNASGLAFNATAGEHKVTYSGLTYQTS